MPLHNYGLNNQAIIQAAQSDDALPSEKNLSRPTMFAETTNTYFYRPSEAAEARRPTTTNSARPSQGSPQGSWVVQPIVSSSKNPLINTAVVHVGRLIKLKCLICGLAPQRKPVTDRPEFCTQSHVAGRYIARAQVCTTPTCQEGWNPEKGRGTAWLGTVKQMYNLRNACNPIRSLQRGYACPPLSIHPKFVKVLYKGSNRNP